ncbi:MAG TPA: di-trans,poly-cis-decaprenylcistransferase [Blastocatellia bacterium]|nr:di-trans,poly-cis-decaprenylcistransferase [Blastocatellia bacterium]
MGQSSLQYLAGAGLHAAIIMDGNGRWATARGLARTAGHRAGADAVRRTVEAAPDCGIVTLTLYAFSADNWQRPKHEVGELMKLLRAYLLREAHDCAKKGVRLSVIGRRDRLSRAIRMAIETAEALTAGCDKLHLRIAVDYSSRDSILRAASLLKITEGNSGGEISRERFKGLITKANNESRETPDVDLLIRTGGEQRLSDFLLWENAYAELIFTKTMWPDFGRDDLAAAVSEFHSRDRRFGRVPEAAAS